MNLFKCVFELVSACACGCTSATYSKQNAWISTIAFASAFQIK